MISVVTSAGIAYLMHVHAIGAGPVRWRYLVALIYLIATGLIVFNWLLVTVPSRKDTRFPFTAQEMARGNYLIAGAVKHEERAA